MKLAVLSDIHSNYYAFRACLEQAVEMKADGIVFLGDYVSDCAYPHKTMESLYQAKKQFKTWFVGGNRDLMIGSGEIPSEFESMCYTYENLSKEDLSFFASMPIATEICIDGYPMFSASHGDFQSTRGEPLPGNDAMQELMRQMKGRLHLCGHTHISFVYENEGRRVVNPGAVGVPHDGTPDAKMAIMVSDGGDWEVNLIQVAYDVEKAVSDIHTSGLAKRAEAFSRSVIATLRTGHDYRQECLKLIKQYTSHEDASHAPLLWAKAADALGI